MLTHVQIENSWEQILKNEGSIVALTALRSGALSETTL